MSLQFGHSGEKRIKSGKKQELGRKKTDSAMKYHSILFKGLRAC
jgi:hypothetical protein